MTIRKNRLMGGGSALPIIGRMTATERAMGRYLRNPEEHPPAGDPPAEPAPIDPAAHAALAAAHERLKKDAQADRSTLKEIKEQLAAIEAEKEQAEAEKAKASGDVEAIRTQLETKHGREVASLTERAEKAERQVEKLVIDNGLSSALDAANIKPELKRAAAAMLREGIELRDDDGEPVAYKGGLPLSEAIRIWSEGDDGKPFVLAGNNGGGALGGGKGLSGVNNPWATKTFNLTEQDRIEREKPDLATRLKAEAGAA